MGIDQPKVSALLSGRLKNFSSERLMRLLTRLGKTWRSSSSRSRADVNVVAFGVVEEARA